MIKPALIRKLKQLDKNNGIIIRVGYGYNFNADLAAQSVFHPADGGFHVSYYSVCVSNNKIELMGRLCCPYPSFIA